MGLRAVLRVISRRRETLLATGFRAFRSTLIAQLPEAGGRRVALEPLLRAGTRGIGSVTVRNEPRRIGRSNYTLGRLVRLALTELAADLRPRNRDKRRDRSYDVRAVTESNVTTDAQ